MTDDPYHAEMDALFMATGNVIGKIMKDICALDIPNEQKDADITENAMTIAAEVSRFLIAMMNPHQLDADTLRQFMAASAELYAKKTGN